MNTKRLKIIAIISMFIDHIPRIIPWQMWAAIADSLAILFPGKEGYSSATQLQSGYTLKFA